MHTITLCTTNEGKRREFARILNLPLQIAALALDELQAIDPTEVSRAKAAQAYAALGRPVLVDDTAFSLAALNGFPGALVAWVIKAGGAELLDRMLPAGASRAATAITVVSYADAAGVTTFRGSLEGHVIPQRRGNTGFGFDSVFIPAGQTTTLAEMPPELKDTISPRGIALRGLSAFLISLQ